MGHAKYFFLIFVPSSFKTRYFLNFISNSHLNIPFPTTIFFVFFHHAPLFFYCLFNFSLFLSFFISFFSFDIFHFVSILYGPLCTIFLSSSLFPFLSSSLLVFMPPSLLLFLFFWLLAFPGESGAAVSCLCRQIRSTSGTNHAARKGDRIEERGKRLYINN